MRVIVPLLLFVALVAGVVFLVTRPSSSPPVESVTPDQLPEERPPHDPSDLVSSAVGEPETQKPEREEPDHDPDLLGGFSNALSGTVRDSGGQPVASAEVLLSAEAMMGEYLAEDFFSPPEEKVAEENKVPPMRTRTNREGKYVFRSIEPKPDYFVIAFHPDFSRVQVPRVQVGEDGDFPGPDVTLVPGPTLEGDVIGPGGLPVVGAEVHTDSAYMLGLELESPDRVSAITDASGHYVIKNVPEGPRNVMAVAQGFGMKIRHEVHFLGTEGERVTIDFQLEVGEPLGGYVLGPDGQGLPGARVLAIYWGEHDASRGETVTDIDGRFLIEGLKKGPYMVRAMKDGYRLTSHPDKSRHGKPRAGDLEVELYMAMQSSISGHVLTEDGSPVTDFTASLQYVDETQSIFSNTGVSERFRGVADGAYSLTGVDPGVFVVKVKAKGFAPTTSKPVQVTARDGAIGPVTVRLSVGGAVSGRVVDAGGKPVKGALVRSFEHDYVPGSSNALFASAGTRAKTRTNANGNFKLPLLRPANYQIHIEHKHFAIEVIYNVQVARGGNRELHEVTLRSGGIVRGAVSGATTTTRVLLKNPDGQIAYATTTREDGRYEFLRVRPGLYKLSGFTIGGPAEERKRAEVNIKVSSGEELEQDLKLGG